MRVALIRHESPCRARLDSCCPVPRLLIFWHVPRHPFQCAKCFDLGQTAFCYGTCTKRSPATAEDPAQGPTEKTCQRTRLRTSSGGAGWSTTGAPAGATRWATGCTTGRRVGARRVSAGGLSWGLCSNSLCRPFAIHIRRWGAICCLHTLVDWHPQRAGNFKLQQNPTRLIPLVCESVG
jgi:hypothetical protein